MNQLENLTIIIVTYKTDNEILKNCLNSIDKNVKIKIIENSFKSNENEFSIKQNDKISINYTGKNLGYGGGNNYGFNLTETDFALVANPDIIFEKDFFEKIKDYLDQDLDFSIIGAQYKKDKVFLPCGLFEENKKKNYNQNIVSRSGKNFDELKKVDWITGCLMLINLKKFNSKKLFDENFFLYFEEFDLCKREGLSGGSVFSSSKLLIHHLGFKGSIGANQEMEQDANKLREWHWMWSTFYFYKKNYSYFFAFKKTIGKLIRALFKLLYFTIIFNVKSKNKYKARFSGLFNSMCGKKSWYRVNEKF